MSFHFLTLYFNNKIFQESCWYLKGTNIKHDSVTIYIYLQFCLFDLLTSVSVVKYYVSL